MEPARTLTRERFSMEALRERLRNKLREKAPGRKEPPVFRYEVTARIRERDEPFYLDRFTL